MCVRCRNVSNFGSHALDAVVNGQITLTPATSSLARFTHGGEEGVADLVGQVVEHVDGLCGERQIAAALALLLCQLLLLGLLLLLYIHTQAVTHSACCPDLAAHQS